ncbi:MAG: DUF1653 domain-containing protein [bacterium]|nr:DUF1653 domain-containing protein [bacterium]
MDIKIGGLYRHYKNKLYKVIGIAKDCNTFEDIVVYEAQYENPLGKLWVRPLKKFLEEVEIDGKKVKRFILVT